ncbi:hypothetical protein LXL04_019703 [Taraxacum kok-saghyz]
MALILKWKWRFFTSPDDLWAQVIKTFYGSNGGFFTDRRPTVGGSPWSRILAATAKLHRVEVVPRLKLRRRIGDGRNTRDSDCRVADKWDGQRWSSSWQRELVRGRTVDDFVVLQWMLEDVHCTDSRDTWSWDISPDGIFTVADTRRWIDDLVIPVGAVQTRWCSLVPRKVNIFIWRLLLGALPTRERLSRWGLDIQCELAITLWEGVFRWLQIPNFGELDLKEIFAWVDRIRMRNNQKTVLEVVICATLWLIWRYQNDVAHDSRKLKRAILLDSIKEYSFVWFRYRQKKVLVS